MADHPGWEVGELGDAVGGFDGFFAAEILPRFTGAELRRRSDAARIEAAPGTLAVSCDSFTVDPPEFPGGDIGTLAVCGTANDLLSEAARPDWLLLSVVASSGLDRRPLQRAIAAFHRQAERSGAELIGGDTKTVGASPPQLLLTVTGLGRSRRVGEPLELARARPGDELILTGDVGRHAIAVLSAREGLGFETVLRSDCADLGLRLLPLVAQAPELVGLRDVTRGGLSGVLHELAASSGQEVRLERAAVPVRRPVLMACELLGLDPLDLANEGCLLLVVRAGAGEDVVGALRSGYGCPDAARIGFVQQGSEAGPRVLVEDGGALRVLARPRSLGLPRLC